MSATSSPPVSDPIASQAIAWAVRLGSGEVSEAERQAFATWRQADPRHEAAVARLEESLGLFAQLPTAQTTRRGARLALSSAQQQRRRLLRNTLGLGFLGLGSGLILNRQQPLRHLLADAATGTGERRQLDLPDGSRLWLNARSAVNLYFTGTSREIELRAGELIVQVSRDPERPFIVHSDQGSVRALGTRFLVRQEVDATLVSVLHSAVRIDTHGGGSATLHAGSSARFGPVGIRADTTPPGDASAWEDGFIEVHDRPLSELVAALQAYRPGLLRISPAAGQLRVTGSFPLDDSERSLDALAEALPIRITRRTRYWVSIDLL